MGILYKGLAATAMLAGGVVTQAVAGAEPEEATEVSAPAATEAQAVEACTLAAGDRMAGEVADSTVTRIWRGREGYIVALTLVNEAGGRRDYTCREGRYGMHVARG